MKHNPRLNERVAALPGHARLHPAQEPKRAQGALELMWLLQSSLSEICGLPHVSLQPSAGSHGELAGPAADPRLPRRPRRGADQGPDPRHRARHQPRHGDDGRLRGGQARDERAGRDRPRRPPRQGRRRHGLPDAHQPEHPRPLRREHRRDRQDRPRRRRHPLLRRRQPERDHGPLAAGRHGLRHRPRQPAQVLLPAPRRGRPGRRADRVLGADRALPAAAAGRPPRGPERRGAQLRPRLRPAQVDRPPARLPGQLRRLRPLLRLHPQPRRRRPAGGIRDRGAQRQLPARQDERGHGGQVRAGRLRPPPACTSSSSPARPRSGSSA